MQLNEIQIRDPFILREGNTLYLYGSTDPDIWRSAGIGFDVYKSQGDLNEFEGPFPAFRPPMDFWAEKNFWAPEVHCHNGSYYMFATFLPKEGRRGTAVLKSSSPLGPFIPISDGPVTPRDWECLDGTLFVENNLPYMVFCHEWQQVGDGQICVLPLTADLSAAAGESKLLFSASSASWAHPLIGRAPGSYVTDGPFMYRAKNNALLMLWSSFGASGKYCIGVATSSSGKLAGPWVQQPLPLYEADGGHGMLFEALDGRLHLAIHTPNKSPLERALFLPIEETDGTLVLAKSGMA